MLLARRRNLFGALLAVLLMAGCTSSSGQRPAGSREAVTDEAVDHDLHTAGEVVRIVAPVNGDVAAAGRDVTIAAAVDGYVMGAGRNVTLDGPIQNDAWLAGENVNVDSEIGSNAMIAGRTVHLRPGAAVAESARLAGQHVRTEGRVGGDLSIGATTAEIGGEIEGAVRASAAEVRLLPGAIIHGDLIVESPNPPELPAGVQVLGNVTYRETAAGGGWGGWSGWVAAWIWLFLSLLVAGAVVLAVVPEWTARVADTIRERTGMSMVSGVLILAGAPLMFAALLVTLIGIPLALVLLGLYVAALVLAGVFVSYRVGEWLLKRPREGAARHWGALALGVLVVSLGISLPFVGWIVALLVLLTGAGALLLERRDARWWGRAGPV